MADLRGGIDLGGTKIQTAVVGADGDVLGQARRPTPTEGGPEDVAGAMAAAMGEAAAEAGVETKELAGIGVGSPGDADEKTGVVSSARNLPGWEGSFPLGEKLQEELGTEVKVGNDVQVATEAEFHLGAGKEFESLIGVFWGTGVGGGLVLDGRPWLGRGAAGEIGHVVVKHGGAKCPCGRRGCLEAYAGRSAMEAEARRRQEEGEKTDLFKLMEKHDKPRLTSGIWERALDHQDKLAEHLIERAIEALGTGVASAINLLDVEAVILGGGLGIRFGERLMDPLMKEMGKHLFVDERPPAVRVASLGDLGGAIGASLLVSR
ncbi:MAG TPA: ROK family protein [Solirubrobacterales bacterium]|nr:ROK family protein [Solirubrobacterales bacterium]